MGTRSSGCLQGSPPQTGYVLEGGVLEVWPGAQLHTTGAAEPRPSVTAWRIRQGHINGVDVARQVVLVVSTRRPGVPDEAFTRLILLDERATPEQVLALLDAFGGKLGGPLADQAPPAADKPNFSQVPITFRRDGRRGVVSVPHRLRLVFRLDPAGAAHASEIWVNVPEPGVVGQGDDPAVTYREFRFARGQITSAATAVLDKEESS
ncbi:MAG: DUF1326 domain-containing protein [Acidimicrobiia bacterium]